jgi:hypothetical protein
VTLFGEEAAKQTVEAINKGREHSHEVRRLAPLKTAEPTSLDRSGEWHEKVAREANKVGMNALVPQDVTGSRQRRAQVLLLIRSP